MFEWMKDSGRNTENVPCRAVIYHHLIMFKLRGSWMAEISNLKSGRSDLECSSLNCFQLDWTQQVATFFYNSSCRLDDVIVAVSIRRGQHFKRTATTKRLFFISDWLRPGLSWTLQHIAAHWGLSFSKCFLWAFFQTDIWYKSFCLG